MISQLNNFVDLKSFFSTNSSSGSGSGPSTHESVMNIVVSEEGEVQGDENLKLGDVEVQVSVPVAVENAQPPNVEGIRIFVLDIHLVSDPGLHVPIDRFHPDIRANV